jgi:hypothetical protein
MIARRRPAIGEWTPVLIDEQFRKSVAFIYQQDKKGLLVPRATVTLVQAGLSRYAVTNVHVVRQVRAAGRPSVLRMNRVGMEPKDLPFDPDAWMEHGETAAARQHGEADVALALIGDWPDNADHVTVPGEMLADSVYASGRVGTQGPPCVGLGDDVFLVGLFAQHAGTDERMQPIVRFGQISRMPNDRVRIKLDEHTSTDVYAYLVETKSWGGQSGSPVFIHYAPDRLHTGVGGNMLLNTALPPKLLGIVHGHFHDKGSVRADGPEDDAYDLPLIGNVKLNTGIAIVIPAQAIIDLLMDDEFVDERNDRVKERDGQQRSLVTPDVAADESEQGEFERFEDLTRKLVNQPKPQDERES